MKMANLPRHHDLANYDYKVSSSISQKQMNELRQMLWVEQVYNLVLMGPSGTGKSFIAAGLINDAVALFNMINHLHEQCSLIITTNKSPKQWAESM
jgi:DNA replication protein DnaC